jgi:hypothetical protein
MSSLTSARRSRRSIQSPHLERVPSASFSLRNTDIRSPRTSESASLNLPWQLLSCGAFPDRKQVKPQCDANRTFSAVFCISIFPPACPSGLRTAARAACFRRSAGFGVRVAPSWNPGSPRRRHGTGEESEEDDRCRKDTDQGIHVETWGRWVPPCPVHSVE